MITFSEHGKTELLKAFIAAQGEMDGAKKRASNPAFKTKYADLGAVCDAVMEALNKHGIGVIQSPTYDTDGVHVETILVHEGGGTMSETLTMSPSKTDPQGIGSVITYIRRYALSAICGVAPEDDDGNAASNLSGGKSRQAATEPNQDPYLDKKEREILGLLSPDACDAFYRANNNELKQKLSPEDYNPLMAKLKSRRDSFYAPQQADFDEAA